MQYRYKLHHSEKAHDGFFKTYRHVVSFECFSGGMLDNVVRECGNKGDIVGVLPYDPVRREFLLVEQFRIGLLVRGENPPWTQEIVAGFMDVAGESPEDTARRELQEETGCSAKAIHPLIDYLSSPGGSAARNRLFIAVVDADQAATYAGLHEEGEDIRVCRVSLEEMQTKLARGDIDNSTAIIAFQQFFLDNWADKLPQS